MLDLTKTTKSEERQNSKELIDKFRSSLLLISDTKVYTGNSLGTTKWLLHAYQSTITTKTFLTRSKI